MTHIIKAGHVDEALIRCAQIMKLHGVEAPSRNGPVVELGAPVLTEYLTPQNRVSMLACRDANPFFHLLESMWMLAGRSDVRFLAYYAANLVNYSDDGIMLNGAYGYRWRRKFGFDQLNLIIDRLRSDPNDRRQVLTMWSPEDLQFQNSKDLPCNTHIYFRVVEGRLDMLVCNRSNDMVWGAYGANVVHFSMLQEYVASSLGMKMGIYRHLSNNMHYYPAQHETLVEQLYVSEPRLPQGSLFAMFSEEESKEEWDISLIDSMIDHDKTGPASPFFFVVVRPMVAAWRLHKMKHTKTAAEMLSRSTIDWHVAATAWLLRRIK